MTRGYEQKTQKIRLKAGSFQLVRWMFREIRLSPSFHVRVYVNLCTKRAENVRERALLLTMRHDCDVSAVLKAKNGHVIRKGLYTRNTELTREVTGSLDSITHFPFQPYHEIWPSFNESGPSNVPWYYLFEHFCILARQHARVSCANPCQRVCWINWRHARRYRARLGNIVISWKYRWNSLTDRTPPTYYRF